MAYKLVKQEITIQELAEHIRTYLAEHPWPMHVSRLQTWIVEKDRVFFSFAGQREAIGLLISQGATLEITKDGVVRSLIPA